MYTVQFYGWESLVLVNNIERGPNAHFILSCISIGASHVLWMMHTFCTFHGAFWGSIGFTWAICLLGSYSCSPWTFLELVGCWISSLCPIMLKNQIWTIINFIHLSDCRISAQTMIFLAMWIDSHPGRVSTSEETPSMSPHPTQVSFFRIDAWNSFLYNLNLKIFNC